MPQHYVARNLAVDNRPIRPPEVQPFRAYPDAQPVGVQRYEGARYEAYDVQRFDRDLAMQSEALSRSGKGYNSRYTESEQELPIQVERSPPEVRERRARKEEAASMRQSRHGSSKQISPENANKEKHISPMGGSGVIDEEKEIEPPKYNFEEILRQAMQAEGQDFKEDSPAKPAERQSQPKKGKFLKRKNDKYDPLKAAKEQKKKPKKEYKSAFPEGLIKKKKTDEEEAAEGHSERPAKAARSNEHVDKSENEKENDDPTSPDEESKKPAKPFLKRKTKAVQF